MCNASIINTNLFYTGLNRFQNINMKQKQQWRRESLTITRGLASIQYSRDSGLCSGLSSQTLCYNSSWSLFRQHPPSPAVRNELHSFRFLEAAARWRHARRVSGVPSATADHTLYLWQISSENTSSSLLTIMGGPI